jgi:hypothetical protein
VTTHRCSDFTLPSLFDSAGEDADPPASRQPLSRPPVSCDAFVAPLDEIAATYQRLATQLHAPRGLADPDALAILESSWRAIAADLDDEDLEFDDDAVVVLGRAFKRWIPRTKADQKHAILPRNTAIAAVLAHDEPVGDELALLPSVRPWLDVLVDVPVGDEHRITLLRVEKRRRPIVVGRIEASRSTLRPSAPV